MGAAASFASRGMSGTCSDRVTAGARSCATAGLSLDVRAEVDVAGVAVHFTAQALQGGDRLLRTSTEWAEHIPLQVEEAEPRGLEARFEHFAARLADGIRDGVSTQAGQREVVAGG